VAGGRSLLIQFDSVAADRLGVAEPGAPAAVRGLSAAVRRNPVDAAAAAAAAAATGR